MNSAATPKQRVLVVDDDKAVRESLRRSLEFNGYDVSVASDGAEALAGLGAAGPMSAPDVVVMDVMMPRLDGNVWLIDPAAYGGHREVDIAMLTLFGLPHLPRVLEAYQERAPLAEGWEDRVPVHQLFPLLVHAALFGGGYGARAAEAAARYA